MAETSDHLTSRPAAPQTSRPAAPVPLKIRVFRLGFALLPRLPEGVARGAGAVGAWLWWALDGRTRARVAAQLRHLPALAASPERLQRATRGAFGHLIQNYIDLFRPVASPELERIFPVDGQEHIRAALAEERGVIFFTTHADGFERSLYRIVTLLPGRRVAAPVEAVQPPELARLTTAMRARGGLELMPADDPATLRALITVLRGGGAVILPVDRDITRTGIIAPLFGAPARVPTGVATLARLTGALAVGVFPWREGPRRYHGIAYPPLRLAPARGEAAIRAALAPILRIEEAHIAAHPEQWLAVFAGDVWTPTAEPAHHALADVGEARDDDEH